MFETAKDNCLLVFLYGGGYRDELGTNMIRYSSSRIGMRGKHYLQLVALVMILVNLVMAVCLFPVYNLLVYLTNWIMLLTSLCVLLALLNSSTS